MGFFEDLGKLIEKYNVEIHPIQLDENIKILNDRLHLALTREDLPPPIILFRTSEGDFANTVLGPVFRDPTTKNIKFYNIQDTSKIISLYSEQEQVPAAETKAVEAETTNETTVTEEAPMKEKKARKSRKSKKTAETEEK